MTRLQIQYFYHGGGKSITGHLEALICFGFNYCNDFTCVTDELHESDNYIFPFSLAKGLNVYDHLSCIQKDGRNAQQ